MLSELAKFGLPVKQLIVNNVVNAPDSNFLKTRAQEQSKYLNYIHQRFGCVKITELPMFPHELKGFERLKEAGDDHSIGIRPRYIAVHMILAIQQT